MVGGSQISIVIVAVSLPVARPWAVKLMAVSLLAVSLLYQRFVFRRDQTEAAQE